LSPAASGGTGPNRHKARPVRSAPEEPRQDGLKNTFANLDAHPATTSGGKLLKKFDQNFL